MPIATAAVLYLTWPLPLRSSTAGAAAIVIASLTIGTLRRAQREWYAMRTDAMLVAAVSIALATVSVVTLGYAAFALVRVGVLGPVTRLGYPFLVATGLRLEGGVWLALMCGIVSVVPLLFRSDRVTGSS